jgi:hypothetical protein
VQALDLDCTYQELLAMRVLHPTIRRNAIMNESYVKGGRAAAQYSVHKANQDALPNHEAPMALAAMFKLMDPSLVTSEEHSSVTCEVVKQSVYK